MKFDGICDESIKTSNDLLRFLLSPQSKAFSDTELRTVFKSVYLINLEYRDDSRGMLIAIESSKKPGYEAAGVVFLRMCELNNTLLTDQDRIRQATDLVRCMIEKPHPRLKNYVLTVTTGIYGFLEYRQAGLGQDFVNTLMANIDSGLPEILMAKPLSAKGIDTKPFFAALHQSIEAQGDVKAWLKQHIPAKSRIKAAEITGFKECFEILDKKRKGQLLENQLGL
jgi:hypothetical protein